MGSSDGLVPVLGGHWADSGGVDRGSGTDVVGTAHGSGIPLVCVLPPPETGAGGTGTGGHAPTQNLSGMPWHADAYAALGAAVADPDAGKERVYHALYNTIASELRGWCTNRVKGGSPRIEADDLFQATWANVWQGLDTFVHHADGRGSGAGRLKTWVYTVARNLHLDAARHEAMLIMQSLNALHDGRTASVEDDAHVEYHDHNHEPDFADAVLDRDEAMWAAQSLKAALSPDQVLVLQLTGAGLSQYEIAAVIGLSRQAVKARLNRARQTAYRYLGIEDKRVCAVPFGRRYTRRDAAIAHLFDTAVPT